MILFTLRCGNGHEFEQWFDNGAAFEAKQAAGALRCPDCGETRISKAIMAPNVSRSGKGASPAPLPSACAQGACQACPAALES